MILAMAIEKNIESDISITEFRLIDAPMTVQIQNISL